MKVKTKRQWLTDIHYSDLTEVKKIKRKDGTYELRSKEMIVEELMDDVKTFDLNGMFDQEDLKKMTVKDIWGFAMSEKLSIAVYCTNTSERAIW